ncbi:hypothetical protein OROMI_002863 [Orobanche minor]
MLIGFLYLRYVADPKTLWSWYEPYLKDDEQCFLYLIAYDGRFFNSSVVHQHDSYAGVEELEIERKRLRKELEDLFFNNFTNKIFNTDNSEYRCRQFDAKRSNA